MKQWVTIRGQVQGRRTHSCLWLDGKKAGRQAGALHGKDLQLLPEETFMKIATLALQSIIHASANGTSVLSLINCMSMSCPTFPVCAKPHTRATPQVRELAEARQRLEWQGQLLDKMSEVRRVGNAASCEVPPR